MNGSILENMSKDDREFVYWLVQNCLEFGFMILKFGNKFPNAQIEWLHSGVTEVVQIQERTILVQESDLEFVDKFIVLENDNESFKDHKKFLEIDKKNKVFKGYFEGGFLKIKAEVPEYIVLENDLESNSLDSLS